MKKGWKIFWIVCGVTAVIGLICCVASLALGVTAEAIFKYVPRGGIGWVDDYDDEDEALDYKGDYVFGDSLEYYENVQNIAMEMNAGNIKILPYDGDCIEVETDGVGKKLKFCSYMDGDTLKLRSNMKIRRTNGVSIGTIYLRVPQNIMLREVLLDVGIGTLNVESITAEEISVEVGAGTAEIHNFQAQRADISCGTGEISVTGNVDSELDIENDIGSIRCNITGHKEDFNYDVGGAVGSVWIDGREYSGIGFSEHKEGTGHKQMDIECGLGEIVVNFTHL